MKPETVEKIRVRQEFDNETVAEFLEFHSCIHHFTSAEIAKGTGLTKRQVKKARSRLRKEEEQDKVCDNQDR
jgi:hypothetical protein